MLEDNLDDAALIERMLVRDNITFLSRCVDTRNDFIDAIRGFQPDVVLSDHGLPEFNSIEALKITRHEMTSTPFILVTGTVSEEFAVNCLKHGADDYILKSNLSRLPSALRRAVKERRLQGLKRDARRLLRKQNHELMKVNKELDNFVYSISHNLRAPLTSVMGLLNLAHLEEQTTSLEQLHLRMRCSIEKLDETLKEILDYSKNVRNGLNIEQISWKTIIDNSFKKLEYLDSKSISKIIDIDAAGATFLSDPSRLEIIFHNLFSNAIRYSKQHADSYIKVTVEVSNIGAQITVQDDGIGIKEIYLPKVFDMFYRATEKSDGAGLGLYIVRETVARLNGSIKIESVLGRGTIVQLHIPACQITDAPVN